MPASFLVPPTQRPPTEPEMRHPHAQLRPLPSPYRPRSMPVFPKRARPLDPVEERILAEYRAQIAAEIAPLLAPKDPGEVPTERAEKLARNRRERAPMYRLLGRHTQHEIAETCGVHVRTVHRILRGDHVPDVFLAARMARALKVKFSEFFAYLLIVRARPLG